MKKNKLIICSVIIILISLLFEFALSNTGVLLHRNYPSKNYNSIEEISTLDNVGYVKKIQLTYTTNKNDRMTVKLKTYDNYNNLQERDINIQLLAGINNYTINVDKGVKKIELVDLDSKTEISSINIKNDITFSEYRFIFFVITFALFGFTILYRKILITKLHIMALLIILGLGSLMIVTAPAIANQTFDEQVHIYKVYTNSYLNATNYSAAFNYASESPGIQLPNGVENRDAIDNYLNGQTEIITTVNKSKFVEYSEIPYLIMSSGMALARLLGLSFSNAFYLGKFFNLLMYGIISCWAIRVTPKGKKIFFVLALMPTALFTATHYTYDSVVNCGAMLSIAYFIKLYYQDEKVNTASILGFSIPLFFVCFSKAIYAPLYLLLLLLPKEKFENKKQRITFSISLIIMFFVLISSFLLPALTGGMAGDARGGNTSVTGQMVLMLAHPIGAIELFISNILGTLYKYFFTGTIYTNFAYMTQPADYITMLYMITMLYIIFISGKEFAGIKNITRFWIFALSVAICALIYCALYLAFSEVGSMIISGVQARYFIPLLIPMIIAIVPRIKIIDMNEQNVSTVMIISMIIVVSVSVYYTVITTFGI